MLPIDKLIKSVTLKDECDVVLWRYDPKLPQDKWHNGIDLYTYDVYSCSTGTVIAIGTDGDTYSVTVQQDANTLFRYCNLYSIDVQTGAAIQAGFRIGVADDMAHFEYCTREQSDSVWVVRVGTEQYYKHNPLEIF